MTVYAAFAQGESESCRDLARLSVRRRFEQGKPLYLLHKAFGYTRGRIPGTFEIVPEEAEVVRQIYRWIREGYTAGSVLKRTPPPAALPRGSELPRTGIFRHQREHAAVA